MWLWTTNVCIARATNASRITKRREYDVLCDACNAQDSLRALRLACRLLIIRSADVPFVSAKYNTNGKAFSLQTEKSVMRPTDPRTAEKGNQDIPARRLERGKMTLAVKKRGAFADWRIVIQFCPQG